MEVKQESDETAGSNQEKSVKKSNNLVKQIVSGLFAVVLLYLAFHNVDPQKLWQYSRDIDPLPLVPVCLTAIFSHVLRAYRWTFLLYPVAGRKIGLFNSFYAVILGYAVNVAIPRGGEVARLLSICKDEKLPWAGVLPTMLIDRMLDMAMLVFLLGVCLLVLPKSLLAAVPGLIPGGIGLLIATIIGLLLLPNVGAILKAILNMDLCRKKLPSALHEKLLELAAQFESGTRALKSPVTYPLIAALSFVIWSMYWLNFYFMLPAFHLDKLVGPMSCLIVFTIGSVGVLIPTPGNAGSFHFLVALALTKVAPTIPYEQALAYATVLHVLTFVMTNCIPAALLFLYRKTRESKPSST